MFIRNSCDILSKHLAISASKTYLGFQSLSKIFLIRVIACADLLPFLNPYECMSAFASTAGSSASTTKACTHLSKTVGIPKGRLSPFPLGIHTLLIPFAEYVDGLSIIFFTSPIAIHFSLDESSFLPSIPGVLLPLALLTFSTAIALPANDRISFSCSRNASFRRSSRAASTIYFCFRDTSSFSFRQLIWCHFCAFDVRFLVILYYTISIGFRISVSSLSLPFQ